MNNKNVHDKLVARWCGLWVWYPIHDLHLLHALPELLLMSNMVLAIVVPRYTVFIDTLPGTPDTHTTKA